MQTWRAPLRGLRVAANNIDYLRSCFSPITIPSGFRWFAVPGDGDSKRVLLRVIGPPYYTLLRAIDRTASGTIGHVRAYLERAPRVWVEIGHTHPLAAQIRVADTQLLLIRSPREW